MLQDPSKISSNMKIFGCTNNKDYKQTIFSASLLSSLVGNSIDFKMLNKQNNQNASAHTKVKTTVNIFVLINCHCYTALFSRDSAGKEKSSLCNIFRKWWVKSSAPA